MKSFTQFIIESANLQKIKDKYDEYNKKLFDNALPNVAIEIKKMKPVAMVDFDLKNNKTILDSIQFSISDEFDFHEEQSLNHMMAHEMIHIDLAINNKHEKEGHGKLFLSRKKEIEKICGFEIPITCPECTDD